MVPGSLRGRDARLARSPCLTRLNRRRFIGGNKERAGSRNSTRVPRLNSASGFRKKIWRTGPRGSSPPGLPVDGGGSDSNLPRTKKESLSSCRKRSTSIASAQARAVLFAGPFGYGNRNQVGSPRDLYAGHSADVLALRLCLSALTEHSCVRKRSLNDNRIRSPARQSVTSSDAHVAPIHVEQVRRFVLVACHSCPARCRQRQPGHRIDVIRPYFAGQVNRIGLRQPARLSKPSIHTDHVGR